MNQIKSFISWVGGKSESCHVIKELIPDPCPQYIEVFGGAAWVLFAKEPSPVLEVYNDFNSNLFNLFQCVRDRPLALCREAGFLPLNSREDFDLLLKIINHEAPQNLYISQERELAQEYFEDQELKEIMDLYDKRATEQDVVQAASFYKVIRYSYGSGCRSYGGRPINFKESLIPIFHASDRLLGVKVENLDFEAAIKKYDSKDAFIYCDPPYLFSEDHYAVKFTIKDHVRLRDVLAGSKAKCLISYNNCEPIKEMYKDFHIAEFTRPHNLKQRYEGGCQFEELFIANYDLHEQWNSKPRQMTLYEEDGNCIYQYDQDFFKDYRDKSKNSSPVYISKDFGKLL